MDSEGSTDKLDDSTITEEAKYSVNITKSRNKITCVYATMKPAVFCILIV